MDRDYERGQRRAGAAADRRARALELRAQGFTFKAIGAQMGITAQRAHQLVARALAAPAPAGSDPATRRLEEARLAEIEASLWRRRGEPAVARVLVDVFARRQRLRELDDPPPEAPPAAAVPADDGDEDDLDLDLLSVQELETLKRILDKAKRGRVLHFMPPAAAEPIAVAPNLPPQVASAPQEVTPPSIAPPRSGEGACTSPSREPLPVAVQAGWEHPYYPDPEPAAPARRAVRAVLRLDHPATRPRGR